MSHFFTLSQFVWGKIWNPYQQVDRGKLYKWQKTVLQLITGRVTLFACVQTFKRFFYLVFRYSMEKKKQFQI